MRPPELDFGNGLNAFGNLLLLIVVCALIYAGYRFVMWR